MPQKKCFSLQAKKSLSRKKIHSPLQKFKWLLPKQTAEHRNIRVDGQNTTIVEIKTLASIYITIYTMIMINIVFYEIQTKFHFWVYQGAYFLNRRKSKFI